MDISPYYIITSLSLKICRDVNCVRLFPINHKPTTRGARKKYVKFAVMLPGSQGKSLATGICQKFYLIAKGPFFYCAAEIKGSRLGVRVGGKRGSLHFFLT